MRNQSIVLLKAFFPLAAFKIFSLFLVFCSFIMIYIYIYVDFFLFTLNEIARNSWFCGLMFPSALGKFQPLVLQILLLPHCLFAFLLELQLNVFDLFIIYYVFYPLFSVFSPLVSVSFWKLLLTYLTVRLFFMYNLLLNLFHAFIILFLVLEFLLFF